MKTLEPFNLAGTPLRKGVTLIEAGAGTGKTFTIAGLILRFVLEEGIGIGQILAVTYTIAATAELRDRVRKRLRSALDDLRRGESKDEITAGFIKNSSADSIAKGIRDLDNAVQNFDDAQIFTIHGFCQRVLRESAFESGALFDMEMLADAAPILDEVARDFWRRRFYTAPPLLARLAIARKKSYHDWEELLKHVRNHPDIRILPPEGKRDSEAIGRLLGKKLDEVIAEWKRSKDDVAEILAVHKDLSRAETAFRPDTVAGMLQSLGQLTENFDVTPPEALDVILSLSNTEIAKKLVKAKQPPTHHLFDLCEEFSTLSGEFFNQLTHEFIAFARHELPLRKERLNLVTYDDLLTRVRDALTGPGGGAFAAMLGGRYRAALIDEFQDTDPVQYEIFRSIFGGGGHHLYFIGDPRQAIYSFRGADVFTYQQAADDATLGFTLDTNWRSEKPLLDAINLLFEKHPSLGGEITYREVHPPQTPRSEFREITGGEAVRLRFRYLQSGQEGGEFNQSNAELHIRQAVVADIARLKAAGVKLGARELQFSDMAVLVRSNAQAAKLQELLRDHGIKSVLKTEKSVFKTDEACELRLLLEGVLEPGRGHFLTTALTTTLIDLQPEDIGTQEEEGLQRQKRLEQFLAWQELWEASGFMAMFRRLLMDEKTRERLVQFPGGERKLANFLHLAELLHHAQIEQRLTPEGLRLWLTHQTQSGESVEEHQLRLESDDDGVLIATIHKSKGLEYPVVFCPYLWKAGDSSKRTEILFHDPEAGKQITLDLRDKSEVAAHDAATGRERFEESLRMMYVALTRAQNLCHVYAGDIKDFDNSPLACILEAPPSKARIEMLAEKSGGNIGLTMIDTTADALVENYFPAGESGGDIHARSFHGSISQTRMIASFSALISDSEKEDVDVDALEIDELDSSTGTTFAALARFDRGVRTGLFWHELLQHLDFQAPADIAPLVLKKLASHGFANVQAEVVCAQVRNLLSVPLGPEMSLERIPMADRLSEAEFSFPIASLESETLRAVFVRHGLSADFSGDLGRLNFRPVEGFMRGFIDLLFQFDGRFYIVDWKSNWLGNRPADYARPNLRSSILRHFYFLQYHLYTVAADLFLRRRIPGYDYKKHFGGVFYIFLRGVDPGKPEQGIFQDCPDAALIRDLRETLTGGPR